MNPTPTPTPTQLRTAEECMEALILADGNMHLAAERVFGHNDHSLAWFVASLSRDPLALQTLNSQLRTLTTLKAFDALVKAHEIIPIAIGNMEPGEFAAFYPKLLRSVSELAIQNTPTVDPADAITRLVQALPPEARRAFMVLVGQARANDADPELPPPPDVYDAYPSSDATGSHGPDESAVSEGDVEPLHPAGSEDEAA